MHSILQGFRSAACIWGVKLPAYVLFLLTALPVAAGEPITYDNLPLGSLGKPLILSTYLPDPGLDEAYFAHYGKSAVSPQYNPGSGTDVEGEYVPIKGLPAALGVNFGPALSFVFDTVECRIAYAWQGGFLDMYPYWGDPVRGSRQSSDYVPRFVGTLFYKASPLSEIYVDGKRLTDLDHPKFIGYDLEKGVPVFLFSRGGHDFKLKVTAETKTPLSLTFTLSSTDKIGISYGTPKSNETTNTLTHTVTGSALVTGDGFPRDMKIKEATKLQCFK